MVDLSDSNKTKIVVDPENCTKVGRYLNSSSDAESANCCMWTVPIKNGKSIELALVLVAAKRIEEG